MSDSPIRLKTFDHITLVVRDLEATRHFYCDLIGMDEVPRPNFSFAGKWFQLGEQQIHLIEQHEDSGPVGLEGPGHLSNTRALHFAFVVEDARVAYEFLKEQGATIVSPPKSRPDGATQTFVADPDGYIVELCQPA